MYIDEIPKHRQLPLILPHLQPQIKLLILIPNLIIGFLASFLNIYLSINLNHDTTYSYFQLCGWAVQSSDPGKSNVKSSKPFGSMGDNNLSWSEAFNELPIFPIKFKMS